MPVGVAFGVIAVTMGIATGTDRRRRKVSRWLTVGASALVLAVAASHGQVVLQQSGLNLAVGAALLLPFVLRGGFGADDASLLASIGAWQGWRFVLYTLWWTAVAGGYWPSCAG